MLALQDVLAASSLVIIGTLCGLLLQPHLARFIRSPVSRPEPLQSDVPPALVDAPALTERLERARMAETQAKSMFENLLANAHEGLILADAQGVIVRFNPEAQRILGRRAQDVTGQQIGILFTEASATKFAQYFDMASQRDPGNSIVAVRYARGRKSDGTPVDLDLSISCVLTADGEVAFLISMRKAEPKATAKLAEGVVRELKKTRDELKATRHRLSVAKLDLAQITHAVSHDLRSPVVNIMGFAEHLDHLAKKLTGDPALAQSKAVIELVEDDIPKTLDFMTRSGRRLCERVEAFRELSRLGKLELAPEDHTVRTLLEVPLATEFGAGNAQSVGLDIAGELAIEVDRSAVEYIVTELLCNARNHRHAQRPLALSISVTESNDFITLAFADNGRGIPEACHEQVFQLFKVAYNADKSSLGRGLAYCARLADLLGGALSCRSEENVGSEFYLQLPRRAAPTTGVAA